MKNTGPQGWNGSGKSRRADPRHTTWEPHDYQSRAVEHLKTRPVAMLWLDPGLGKTSITLKAFSDLLEAGRARKMLVVAPLRVVQLVWRQEAAQWSQFRHLRFATIHGSAKKRRAELETDADVYLVNPENVPWLCDQFKGKGWPFDVLTIDELTRFKNARAKRSKALRPWAQRSKFRWGLTGTPVPNGYMDLFGQALVLDGGRAFGQYVTHFRDRYFSVGWTGFDFELKTGAAKQIEERIEPYVLRMAAEDYLDLPELVNDVRLIEIGDKARKQYKELRREAVLPLADDEGRVVAANAGALHSKLKQLSNGAVYLDTPDGGRRYVHIHDAKLDALDELIEELAGQQLLVGYEFRHDLERLLQRLGPDTPYLGSGVSDKRAVEIEREWNAGNIPVLLAHPASAGHGLNFQKGGAGHVCWFSVTLDYELYDQFLRRIRRQGNTSARVVNHALVVPNTHDELSLDILAGKAVTQNGLLQALNAEVEGDTDMVRKVRRKSEVEETENTVKPKGWSGKASEEDDEEEDDEEAPPRRTRKAKASQKEKVRDRLKGDEEDEDEDDAEEEDEDDDAEEEDEEPEKPGFSRRVKSKLRGKAADDEEDEAEDDEDEAPAPKKPARRKSKRAEPQPAEDAESDEGSEEPPFEPNAVQRAAGVLTPVGGMDDAQFARERALHMTARFAEQLGIRTASDAVKAAKAFETYLVGEK